MKVTGVRTTRLEVPLPMAFNGAPIMSGLGPLTTTGVLIVEVETDQGVVGENLVFTLNNRRLGVLDEMVRGLAHLVVGMDPCFTARFWAEAWREINFLGHKGVPVVGFRRWTGRCGTCAGRRRGCRSIG